MTLPADFHAAYQHLLAEQSPIAPWALSTWSHPKTPRIFWAEVWADATEGGKVLAGKELQAFTAADKMVAVIWANLKREAKAKGTKPNRADANLRAWQRRHDAAWSAMCADPGLTGPGGTWAIGDRWEVPAGWGEKGAA